MPQGLAWLGYLLGTGVLSELPAALPSREAEAPAGLLAAPRGKCPFPGRKGCGHQRKPKQLTPLYFYFS